MEESKTALETSVGTRVREVPQSVSGRVIRYLGAIELRPPDPDSLSMESRLKRSASRDLLVAIIDDDESVSESLPDLLKSFGFSAHSYSSAEEFLASDSIHQAKCLVLDIAMPGMTGLALQRELKASGREIPIVFITANRDEEVRAQALQEGAVAVLFKPFSDTALLDALNAALQAN